MCPSKEAISQQGERALKFVASVRGLTDNAEDSILDLALEFDVLNLHDLRLFSKGVDYSKQEYELEIKTSYQVGTGQKPSFKIPREFSEAYDTGPNQFLKYVEMDCEFDGDGNIEFEYPIGEHLVHRACYTRRSKDWLFDIGAKLGNIFSSMKLEPGLLKDIVAKTKRYRHEIEMYVLPETQTIDTGKLERGVSLRDAAESIHGVGNKADVNETLDKWEKKKPKPVVIGKDPSHNQRNLYEPQSLVNFIVENYPSHEPQKGLILEQLKAKARPPRSKK